MAWILAVATFVVLSSIAVACYRAEAEAAEKLCGCLDALNEDNDAVNGTAPRADTVPTEIRRKRHLHVVGAG